MDKKKKVSTAEKVIGIISKVIVFILIAITLLLLAIGFVKTTVIPAIEYNKAEKLLENGMYEEAIVAFNELGNAGYKDSYDRVYDCWYEQAKNAINEQDYETADRRFGDIASRIEWSDKPVAGFESKEDVFYEHVYLRGMKHLDLGENVAAMNFFVNLPDDYKDVAYLNNEALYKKAYEVLENKHENFAHCEDAEDVAVYVYGMAGTGTAADEAEEPIDDEDYFDIYNLTNHCDRAQEMFESLGNFKDSKEKAELARETKKELIYNKAKEFIENKEFKDAKRYLNYIKDYKDVEELIANHASEFAFSELKTGDIMLFGTFEQDGSPNTLNEKISWTVIDIKGDSALLLARKTLAVLPYESTGDEDVYWEDTSLYEWLNESFILNAFNLEERETLLYNEVTILDRDFAFKRMYDYTSDLTPAAIIAAYDLADAVDIRYSDEHMTAKWWVRPSSGSYARYAYDDSLYYTYDPDLYRGVRPAIWVTHEVMDHGTYVNPDSDHNY